MKPSDYTGAGSRLVPELGLALDPRKWSWMPKIDGVYARISTDSAGCITEITARSGRSLESDLLGMQIGLPSAVLHGELEASTEAGIRAAAIRGWSAVHLFDLTLWHGCDVRSEPFSRRYGLLHRWQAEAECLEVVPRCIPEVPDDSTFLWAIPSDGAEPPRPRARPLFPPGTMRPGSVPRDLRRLPIVPLVRGKGAGEALWRSYVEVGGGEGVVAVRLDAPAGVRGGKRKVKASDTLDCLVVSCSGGVAALIWRGHEFLVSARGQWRDLRAGEVVEVATDGFYESSVTPRFPRIKARRTDLCGRVGA